MWPFSKTTDAAATEQRVSLENPRIPLTDGAAWRSLFDAWNSAAGVTVNVETALGVPAVWCAVNFLANTVASLPMQLFKKGENGRDAATSDPLYALLHDAPNPEWTSYAWRKYSMVNILTRGRAFTFIERNKAGRPMNLWPLDPRNVTIQRRNGRKSYVYKEAQANGSQKTFVYDATEIIDLPFMLEADGIGHVAPISRLAKAIGLSIALESYAEKFFLNGGVPPLALHTPVGSPAAAGRAASDVNQAVRDANAERRNVLIMPTGTELKPIGVDPAKSQMETARLFQIQEIARMYNLPPVFLQDLSRGTFANTEQMDLAFAKHTLVHWLELWEQELNLKLFSARNKVNFVEFNQDGLLRGDFTSRMTGYSQGIQNAIYTPDEVRGFENLPEEGGDAAKLHIQGATVPLGQQSKSGPAPTAVDKQPANENAPTDPQQAQGK